MQDMRCPWLLYAIVFASPIQIQAGEFLRETFDHPMRWQEIFSPRTTNHTTYTIINDGTNRYLEARSVRSASALSLTNSFDVYEHPLIRWRWRVDNAYTALSENVLSGDDYPLRVYLTFEYERKMPWMDRVASIISRQTPPHSSLNYVWASQMTNGSRFASPQTARFHVIVKESGTQSTGIWLNATANILEDYRASFGQDPPRQARIGLMSDSENSGQETTAYIDDIVIASP
jgi:hypothetical protein